MIKVLTILKCNTCHNIAAEQTTENTAMVEWVRMIANEKGWLTTNKNGIERHTCPDCQAGHPKSYEHYMGLGGHL